MKIDLSTLDQTQFMAHQHVLDGEDVWLIQPQHIGAKWTKDNKHFRSSVWNNDGELISAGFPKFTNWGENPEVFPLPTSLKGATVMEKLDGSLLIVSKYRGNFILRTRGTVDATKLDNGYELEIFKETILPKLHADDRKDTWDYSFLFEWTSPVNKIVLNYGDQPEWTLVGHVDHRDYCLAYQESLDNLASVFGLKRPQTYTFSTIEDLMSNVDKWEGKEGVCVYSNNGQTIHKVKASSYLFLHRMKSELGSIDKVIDVWFNLNHPDYQEFEKYVTDTFDYELWKMIRPDASKVCDAYKNVEKIIDGMTRFVTTSIRPLSTRREQAEKILASYGPTNRSAMVFTILDNKPLSSEQKKKLLYQCLKS